MVAREERGDEVSNRLSIAIIIGCWLACAVGVPLVAIALPVQPEATPVVIQVPFHIKCWAGSECGQWEAVNFRQDAMGLHFTESGTNKIYHFSGSYLVEERR